MREGEGSNGNWPAKSLSIQVTVRIVGSIAATND